MLSVTWASVGNTEEPANSVFDFPMGIADPDTQLAFVATNDGIQALKLEDGSTLWTSPQTGIPLFAKSGILTALIISPNGDALAVVLVKCADGKQISRPQPFRVSASDARALLKLDQPPLAEVRSHEIYLTWPLEGTYTGGANPPPALNAPSPVQHVATARISLVSGESEFLGVQTLPDQPARRKDYEVPYERGSELQFGSWTVPPGIQASLVAESVSGETENVLKLRTQYSGSKSFPLGRATNKPPYVTADGKYILLPSSGEAQNGSHVQVFSASTGSPAGSIDKVSTLNGASVIGNRIYYRGGGASPNVEITAVSLPDGKMLWRREFRPRKAVPHKLQP